jgi:radical SAM superfamily enzyme YgiQ (UPF0313 family)
MLQLAEAFAGHDTFWFCYDSATTRALPRTHLVPNMARNPVEFVKNLFRVAGVFRRERPDMVVSTGAEIAIPVVLVAKLFRLPVVYIECGAQVTTPSVTGRLMYWLADTFLVQWPELVHAYGPRAVYRGSLVDDTLPITGDRSHERRMKVSLVQPAHTGGFSSDQPPMGLGYVASVLEQHGCEVRLVDANVERLSIAEVAALLAAQEPDVVGVTVTTPLLPGALDLARALRALPRPPLLVAGGPHATVLPEELLVHDGYDCAVRGEGERTIAEVAEAWLEGRSFEEIEGLSWSRDGQPVHNPDRALCARLEDLPMPDWSLYPLRRYSSLARRHDHSLPIMTSRGCPHRCTFCYKGVYGRDLRMREALHVVDEWQRLVEFYGVLEVAVIDDVFTENTRRALAVCDLLVERGLDKVPWSTTNGIRVTNASPELLGAMHRAGCYRVYFGAESGVQRVVDALGKNISLVRVREAVADAKAAGLEVGVYFMLGNIGETAADMDATIAFALDIDPDLAQFTIATPYPGTEMFRQVTEGGELLVKSWDELATYGGLVFRMGELTPELVNAKYREALRRFYFRPRVFLRQARGLATWTGLRHRAAGLGVLLRMVRPG